MPADWIHGAPPGALITKVGVAMGAALVTDLYELHMAASYLRRSMTAPATFSLSVRALPASRGFLVAAGIEDCLDLLESFAFDDEDAEWLRAHGFDEATVAHLSRLQFTGDVHAAREGDVLLAGEPLVEVTAPLPEAQLVETLLLNRVTFQSAVAAKAARCRLAAGDIELFDFSLRRTQGVDAAMAVARVAAMAGFRGTSNVEAARRLGLRSAGTMAHSYVQAFATEEEAFAAYVADRPPPYTFLVDTYDTLTGVQAAINVARRIVADDPSPGAAPLAIRIDSGDLPSATSEARRMLDAAGLSHVRIFVTGGLDEFELERLRSLDAPVDGAGVGTRLGVSADAPFLDTGYKLVALDGTPVGKQSPGKETIPGPKQVWRREGAPDVLASRDEPDVPGARPLLVPVLRAGRRVAPREPLAVTRARLDDGLAWLPDTALRIREPVGPSPVLSERLRRLQEGAASVPGDAAAPRRPRAAT